jgi:opacity protein-like surface antigen
MRQPVQVIRWLFIVLMLASPRVATAQSVALHSSGGPTLRDTGYSFAAGIGYSPHPRLTLVISYDHTHLSTRTRTYGDGAVSTVRGGTLFLASAELRVAPFGGRRFSPYGLAGLAGGVSRPNVNDQFQSRITNHVQAMFLGGGVHMPVDERISVFADFRFIVGAEGRNGMVAVAPVRAGVTWRF